MTSSQVYAPASVPSGSEDLHDCIPEGPTLSPRSGANVLRCCSRRRNGTSLIALGLQLWKSSKAPDGCTSPPPRASELSRCFRSECASRHLTVTWASAVEIRPAGSPSVSREPRSGWPPARCPGPADHRVRAAQRDIRATRASHSRPRSDHTALRAPCPNPSNLPAGWRGPSTTGSAPSTCAPFLSCVKPGGTEHDTIVDHLGAHVIRVPMPPRDDQLDLPLDRHAPRAGPFGVAPRVRRICHCRRPRRRECQPRTQVARLRSPRFPARSPGDPRETIRTYPHNILVGVSVLTRTVSDRGASRSDARSEMVINCHGGGRRAWTLKVTKIS